MGYVHYDIKLKNLLLNSNLHPYLIDFGCSFDKDI